MYYWWLLFLSILCFLFTANFYLILMFPLINSNANVNLLDYFSNWIQTLNDQQAKTIGGGVNLTFINGVLFFLLFLYLQAVSRKGNETLGYRFACFTFYAMETNETLANAFIFNAFLNCFLQAAQVQYLLESMTFYATGSNAALMSYKIKYSKMMIYYKEKVNMFSFFLIGFSIITLLAMVIAGANRIDFTQLKAKKKDDSKAESKEALVD